MCRTGICRFGLRNWIFLLATLHLFTYAQGGEDLEEGISFTTEPADAVAADGERALLACAARGPRGRVPAISWRHGAQGPPASEHGLAEGDRNRQQLSNGSLLVQAAAATAGHYQCVATLDGVGTIVSRVAMLFLAELPTIDPPPRVVSLTAGSPVLLPCPIRVGPRLVLRVSGAAARDRRPPTPRSAQPPPALRVNVTWLKNGVLLAADGPRASVSPSGALELDPARPHDAGRYRCRVALAASPDRYVTSEESELRVSAEAGGESPPRFVATPRSQTVMEGASVTFDCAAAGSPRPEITWLSNGAAIDLNDLDSRFYLVGSGSLRVAATRALDAGAYTCRAHSPLDSADHTATLHVLTAPRVTVPAPAAAAALRGAVSLRCAARGKPPPSVAWLKNGDPLTPNNHDIQLLDGSSLRIQGVLPVDAGMFQCFASSAAGAAAAAVRLHVLPPMHDPPALSPHTPQPFPKNASQDIFNSLVSSSYPDQDLELDFLGETSSAYTFDPDLLDSDSFHATEGLDLENLEGNATVVSAPRNLKAAIVRHRFVTLTWDEPEHHLEEIEGYAVVYSENGSERQRVWWGGPRGEANVPALWPRTAYTFAVRARTRHAVSPPTTPLQVTTAEEEVSYGPPLAVRADAAAAHSVRLSWKPPALGPLAVNPDKYTVYYTEEDSGREQVQWIDVDPTLEALTATITGLRPAATYWARVAAAGGAPSAEVRARTPADAPAAAPGNVTVVATGSDSLLVRWEAPPPASHRGALTGYKVRYRASPASGSAPRRKAESLTTPADVRRAELNGLEPGTTYQVRVCALNANGSGPFSEWAVAAAPAPARPPAEGRVPDRPPPITTRAGRDWISVWWAEQADALVAVRGYWLGWGLGVPDEHSKELPAHQHSHVIRNLESNAEYVISLRASNALGLGPAVYATVRTRPAAGDDGEGGDEGDEEDEREDDEEDREDETAMIPPVGVKVIMLSGTTAVVYWTDPVLKGQSSSDGRRYVVRWASVAGAGAGGAGAGGAGAGKPRYYNATDLSCMIDDLKPFTRYEFAVKLIKGSRESPWSMLVTNTSLEAPPGSPPRDLRASPPAPPAASRSLDLGWAPPLRPNGVITGYMVMYAITRPGSTGSSGSSGSGGEEWTALAVAGDRGRARLERLRPRTTYLVKVQARNSKGLGPFSAVISHTTALASEPHVRQSGEGGGLAAATSAWLWASAGGACAVLALAAALAFSLCCRQRQPPMSPDTRLDSTYQKSSASAALKPPDLWIHHDQMELKHLDKGMHHNVTTGSTDALGSMSMGMGGMGGMGMGGMGGGGPGGPGGGLMSSTLTLGRAPPAEYEPARHHPPPASLDRRHYVPTYVATSSCGSCGSAESARGGYTTMGGVGVGSVGTLGAGCGPACDRRPHRLMHDQGGPIPMSGMPAPGAASPQSSLGSLPMHHHQPPCGSVSCGLAPCSALGAPPPPAGVPAPGGDIYASAARERGHYVAYEPLGHYTHRDSLSSDTGLGSSAGGTLGPGGCVGGGGPGGGPGCGSLQRRAAAPLHTFSDTSDHSTPTHSNRSVRESSPYKKSASSSPGHPHANRLHLGGAVPACSAELEPLTPSRSTERLQREMQNLEGLMKDLSAITHHQFHC